MSINEGGARLKLCEVENRWSKGWAGGFIYVEVVPCQFIDSEGRALSNVPRKVISKDEVLRDLGM